MCDFTDPRISKAYKSIVGAKTADWLLLGYRSTRDTLSLYSFGLGGLNEFRKHLKEEVMYGFVKVDNRYIFIVWIPKGFSGVKRARAMVHSRSVASIFEVQYTTIISTGKKQVSDEHVRLVLKTNERSLIRRYPLADRHNTPVPLSTSLLKERTTTELSEFPLFTVPIYKSQQDMIRLGLLKSLHNPNELSFEQRLKETSAKFLFENKPNTRRDDKEISLSGFVSVQTNGIPFWKRRYFTIQNQKMIIFKDEFDTFPIQIIDLTRTKQSESAEDSVPNSFTLETENYGSLQLHADDKTGLCQLLGALQLV